MQWIRLGQRSISESEGKDRILLVDWNDLDVIQIRFLKVGSNVVPEIRFAQIVEVDYLRAMRLIVRIAKSGD